MRRSVGRAGGRIARMAKAGHVLPANDLVLVGLLSQELERRLDDASPKAEHQVERALLLDVVVRKRAAVLQLLAREDETLLIGWDALLVLDLGLNARTGST